MIDRQIQLIQVITDQVSGHVQWQTKRGVLGEHKADPMCAHLGAKL